MVDRNFKIIAHLTANLVSDQIAMEPLKSGMLVSYLLLEFITIY